MEHLLKLNEGRKEEELQLSHDDFQGMGETLYLQVSTYSNTDTDTNMVNRNVITPTEPFPTDTANTRRYLNRLAYNMHENTLMRQESRNY